MNHKMKRLIWMLLVSSVIVGCKREPSYSVIRDNLTFDKVNTAHGKIGLIRVDPDGAVVLKHHDKSETTTVRSSEYIALSNRVKAALIASDPNLQTATIRIEISNVQRVN